MDKFKVGDYVVYKTEEIYPPVGELIWKIIAVEKTYRVKCVYNPNKYYEVGNNYTLSKEYVGWYYKLIDESKALAKIM